MGKYKNKTYPLRIDNELQDKMKEIATKEDRPLSKQYERVIKEFINNYESKNGKIELNQINIEKVSHNGNGDINIR